MLPTVTTRSREKARRDAAARTIQRILVLETDPITLGPVRRPFRILRNGATILFDAHSLYAYVHASGDLRDPVTRTPFAKHELSRLSRSCRRPTLSGEELNERFRQEVERREFLERLQEEFAREVEGGLDIISMYDILLRASRIVEEDNNVVVGAVPETSTTPDERATAMHFLLPFSAVALIPPPASLGHAAAPPSSPQVPVRPNVTNIRRTLRMGGARVLPPILLRW